MYDKIFVFMLATFRGSYFQDRVLPTRQTWAKNFEVFVLVAADTQETRDFFEANDCSQTSVYGETFMECFPEYKILVLVTNCTDEQAGAHSPCCKNERAAQTFLNMHKPQPDSWFYFADDDYYTWPDALGAVLSAVNAEQKAVYLITQYNYNTRSFAHRIFSHTRECSNPCVHPHPWAGWTMISNAAMELMRIDIMRGGIMNVCFEFICSHDIGLGIFLWMHALDYITGPFSKHHIRDPALFLSLNQSRNEEVERTASMLQNYNNANFYNTQFFLRHNTVQMHTLHLDRVCPPQFRDCEGKLATYTLQDCHDDHAKYSDFERNRNGDCSAYHSFVAGVH